MQWRIFNRVFTLNFRITKLESSVLGIRSNLDNRSVFNGGLHVLMLDYDARLPLEELIKELHDIQGRFKKGDCEIFISSIKTIYKLQANKKFSFIHILKIPIIKYHVYFFQDMMKYWEACEIIAYSSCCNAFKRWRLPRLNIVLRVSAKSDGFVPQPFMIIKSKYSKPEIRWFKEKVYRALKNEVNRTNIDIIEVNKNRSFSDTRIGNGRNSRHEQNARSGLRSKVI